MIHRLLIFKSVVKNLLMRLKHSYKPSNNVHSVGLPVSIISEQSLWQLCLAKMSPLQPATFVLRDHHSTQRDCSSLGPF